MHSVPECVAPCALTGVSPVDSRYLLSFAHQGVGVSTAVLVLVQADGKQQWKYSSPDWLAAYPALPVTDKSGTHFFSFDTGRYVSVAVLRPESATVEDYDSLPVSGQLYGRFIDAELVEGAEELLEIKSRINSCEPSCAEGAIVEKVYRWNGLNYVE
jgi:hypothetical protein